MPESTLLAFGEHGSVGDLLAADGGDSQAVLAKFGELGVDVDALATKLQVDGAASFVKSWEELLTVIASKADQLRKAG